MAERFIATDPGKSGQEDSCGFCIAEIDTKTGRIAVLDVGKVPARKGVVMREGISKIRKWRDEAGNVYGIEKAVRNGRWVVIRTNAGGNRKAAKHLPSGNAVYAQRELDTHAEANGWLEVKG